MREESMLNAGTHIACLVACLSDAQVAILFEGVEGVNNLMKAVQYKPA